MLLDKKSLKIPLVNTRISTIDKIIFNAFMDKQLFKLNKKMSSLNHPTKRTKRFAYLHVKK
jgi:hypothetical protein